MIRDKQFVDKDKMRDGHLIKRRYIDRYVEGIGYFRLWWLSDESEGREYIDREVYRVSVTGF